MSRSFKKIALWVCSKPRTVIHRRRERRRVRQALNADPLSDIPHRKSRELGNDDWGTKFGMDVSDILTEADKKTYRKGRMK